MGYNYGTVPAPPPRQIKETVTVKGTPDAPPTASLPSASVGTVIPFIQGRQRIMSPNLLWYGNIRPVQKVSREYTTETIKERRENPPGMGLYETVEIERTTVVETTSVVGYRATMLFGLCMGPDVKLRRIYIDNQEVWSGSVGPSRTVINITKGAVTGQAAFSGGGFSQGIEPYISPHITDPTSYPGIAYLCFNDLLLTGGISQISVEVERFPNPLGLGSSNRVGDDLNGASMIADLIVNEWGGAGLDISEIDVDEFRDAASRLYSENNAGAMIVQHDAPVSQVISTVQGQIDGYVYNNPVSGKIGLKLRRKDITGELIAVNERNALSIDQLRKLSWRDVAEQVRLEYTNRADDYNTDEPIILQNPASMGTGGRGTKSVTLNLPTVMVKSLANDLAARELSSRGEPRLVGQIKADRSAAVTMPGDVVFLSWKNYGIQSLPFFVNEIEKAPLGDDTVVLEVEQVPTVNGAIFAVPEDGQGDYGKIEAKPPVGARIMNAPFWMVRAKNSIGYVYDNNYNYPLLLPIPADDVQVAFTAYIENVPNAGGRVEVIPFRRYDVGSPDQLGNWFPSTRHFGQYPTYGKLSASISRTDGFSNGVISSVILDDVVNPANLIGYGTAGIREGRVFVIVGNELMSFEGVTALGGGSYRLDNVHRGLIDTAPADHAVDSDVYVIVNNYTNITGSNYAPGSYTPQWRLGSAVANEETDITTDYYYTNQWTSGASRLNLPYPPDDVKVDGVRSLTPQPVARGGTAAISWRTRSRGSTVVRLQTDTADVAEVNGDSTRQAHRIFLKDSAGTTHTVATTPNDMTYNSMNVTIPAGAAIGVGELWVRSLNEYGLSTQYEIVPVEVLEGDMFISENGGNMFITEDGTEYFRQE